MFCQTFAVQYKEHWAYHIESAMTLGPHKGDKHFCVERRGEQDHYMCNQHISAVECAAWVIHLFCYFFSFLFF